MEEPNLTEGESPINPDGPKAEDINIQIDKEDVSAKSKKDKSKKKSKKGKSEKTGKSEEKVSKSDNRSKSYSEKPPKDKWPFWLGFCATRQLAHNRSREFFIRVTLRELIIYLIYLIILLMITVININASKFYFTKAMADLFLERPLSEGSDRSFRTSLSRNDFWDFANNVMLKGIFQTGSQLNPGEDPSGISILYENKLLGYARLRQLRVQNSTCPAAVYANRIRECFPPYSSSKLESDSSKYNPEGIPEFANKTAWKYHSSERMKTIGYFGKVSYYLNAGGAYVLLKKDINLAKQQITELQGANWITRSTRVVFLDFTVYNPNINLHCVIKLVWEFPATGGVVTSWSLRTIHLFRYISAWDYFVLACQILFILFTLYYLIQEIIEVFMVPFPIYIKNIWTWLDLIKIICSIFAIGYYINSYIIIERMRLKEASKDEKEGSDLLSDEYDADFEYLGFWEAQIVNNLCAVCVFIAFMKLFKYISFNKTMTQLSKTLTRCAKDIFGFAIMFFIVFFAFAQLGYLVFGSQIMDFSTFLDSMFTLLRLILGDFNYREIESANRILGPIFFISYVFFVFFVLLNMFLAIINDTYSEIKAEIKVQRNDFEISDYFKKILNNMRGWCGRRNKEWDAEREIKLAANNGQITYDDLRANLRAADFSDSDIELFLSRYELDQDRALDDDEIQQILSELQGVEGNKGKMHKEANSLSTSVRSRRDLEVESEEISDMQRRMGLLENSLTNFSQKLDILLNKMNSLQQNDK